jgi:AcrR family transcriptional regulator
MPKTAAAASTVAAPRARTRKPPPAKPNGQYHHGDLRRSLVECGTHLLDTEGAEAMSLRSTARMAGVSPAAPAHHFKDKNGLLAAIAAQGFRDMAARSGLQGLVEGDAAVRLHALARDYVQFAAQYPARFQLMFGTQIAHRAQYPELLDAALASYRGLIDVVSPLLGAKAAKAMSVDDFTFCVWGTMHGLAVMASNRLNAPTLKSRLSVDEMAALFARYVIATIRGLKSTPVAG